MALATFSESHLIASKRCSACASVKPVSDFYTDARSTSGYQPACKTCHNERARRWQSKNKDAFLKMCRDYKSRHKDNERERLANWRAKNPEKRRAQEIRARARRSESIYAYARKRSERQKLATPLWANREAIAALYIESHKRFLETGEKHHVDHIIPLQGKLCSGLHVENNLQVIPAIVNLRKQAKFEENFHR